MNFQAYYSITHGYSYYEHYKEFAMNNIICITLIITNKCTYIIFHIKTLKIAPTCLDPKIILRELRCSLLKSF